MKQNIRIKYYINNNKLYCYKLLLKYIKSITIDNIKYSRCDYNSPVEISKYYKLIKKNIKNITEIQRNDDLCLTIKDTFLHNLNGPTIYYLNDKYGLSYNIEGITYSINNWLLKSREIKIKNILKNIQ
jgi:hypothetical protein